MIRDRKKISQKIINTYIKRWKELEPQKQRHFLYRVLKIDKRDILYKKLKEIKRNTEKEQEKIKQYLGNDSKLKNKNLRILKNYQIKKINDKKKLEQWKKHIDIFTFHSVLWSLYYLETFNIKYNFNYKKTLKVKGLKQIKTILANPLFTKFAPVSAINCIYHSKNLLNLDKEKNFLKFFKKVFQNKNKISNESVMFTNYIYGLTHIIIGASKFYKTKVLNYNWVLKEFARNENKIYKQLTLDINTEVALCYKLSGVKNNDFIEKIEERLINNFNPKEGYIEREQNNNFSFAEHTNAIALLLLNFNKIKFYV